MAVVKTEIISAESLFTNLTHVDMQYALWCLQQENPELQEEGRKQFATGRSNARKLVAFLIAMRSVLPIEDRALANNVRRAALLAGGKPGEKTAEAYWDMTALFSELLRPTQPFVARMAFRVL